MARKKFLVPTDFTEVAHTAMIHAADLAKSVDADIILLNIVSDREDLAQAKVKIKEEAAYLARYNPDLAVELIVRNGNIFEDIGDVAEEKEVNIIVMGTHGASGWQKIAGSYALKVITSSKIPFIVTQKETNKESGYDKILVPLDLHNETKQKLEIVADLARYFNSEVHIITPKETDEFLRNKLNGNIAYAKKYLKEKNVKHAAHIAEKSGDFVDQLLDLAGELEVDLITIMNLQRNSLMGMLGARFEQQIITNEDQIPVLCVNPRETTSVTGSVFGNSI
ncbi:MAG: nucleotide-binding universal stress UspA family protein [Flavobacteriales bacterium]|jgi:nucleotide-binding universal stress UspA family protein